MKFIHTADLHFNKERAPMVLRVLDGIIGKCKSDEIDAVLICGDFWDSTVTVSDASGFNLALDKMEELAGAVPVYMIYGTPSHENAGSLHVFELLGCNVLKDNRGNPYAPSFTTVNEGKEDEFDLVAIPEPRLSMTMGKTLDEKYANVQKSFDDMAECCRLVKKDCPRIVMLHGLIAGAVMDNGMGVPRGETAVDRDVLDRMNADVILCGHIHRKQKVGGMGTPCYYSGSIPPKTFGETHEASFNIVEV